MPEATTQRRPPSGVAPKAATPTPPKKAFPFLLVSDVEERPIHFLWKPYIPMGTVTMIFGHGGVGKSWLTAKIVAHVTRGLPLPGEPDERRDPMNVLIVASEDDPSEVLRPRLRLLDADMTRIAVLEKPFRLDAKSIEMLEETLKLHHGMVLFIDPLVAYLGKDIDISQANNVRDVLQPLNDVARRTGAAIILVHHSRKGRGNDQQEAMGSADFINGPRSAIIVQRSPEGKIMRHVKSNWAKNGPSLTFNVVEDDWGAPRFDWGDFSADDARPKFREPVAKQKATDYIQEALKDGPKPALEMLQGAKKLGINERTLDRAKKGLAASIKEFGEWRWYLLARGNIDAPVRPPAADAATVALAQARSKLAGLKRRSEVHDAT